MTPVAQRVPYLSEYSTCPFDVAPYTPTQKPSHAFENEATNSTKVPHNDTPARVSEQGHRNDFVIGSAGKWSFPKIETMETLAS